MPVSAKGSEATGPLVVELIGALIDDRGAFARTVVEVLGREGLEPRPGSLDQVAGAAAPWALATLLEGHGRDGDRLAALVAAVTAGWLELARSGQARARPASVEAVRNAAARRPVGLLTALPAPVAAALLVSCGVDEPPGTLLVADGDEGLPRPGVLTAWLVEQPGGGAATALLASAPAILAALGARCGEVVVVGGGAAAAMLSDRHAPSVEAALAVR